MTVSTGNFAKMQTSDSNKFVKMENPDSSVQVQTGPNLTFQFVLWDTRNLILAFCWIWVGVAFSVETVLKSSIFSFGKRQCWGICGRKAATPYPLVWCGIDHTCGWYVGICRRRYKFKYVCVRVNWNASHGSCDLIYILDVWLDSYVPSNYLEECECVTCEWVMSHVNE